MIRRIHFPAWACGIVLGIVFAASPSHSAFSSKAEAHEGERPDTVFGPWTTADGHGVILIEPCGDAVCGRIVGIGRAAGEPIPKDVHGELQCGLTIITRERPIGDGTWEGKITDPRSGTTYGAQIRIDEQGNLRLRGYLGLPVFGQTQTWHHYAGQLSSTCEMT